jgi:hypothetical protein
MQALLEIDNEFEDALLRGEQPAKENVVPFLDALRRRAISTNDANAFEVSLRLFRKWKTYLMDDCAYVYREDIGRTTYVFGKTARTSYLRNLQSIHCPRNKMVASFGMGDFIEVTGNLPTNAVIERGIKSYFARESNDG